MAAQMETFDLPKTSIKPPRNYYHGLPPAEDIRSLGEIGLHASATEGLCLSHYTLIAIKSANATRRGSRGCLRYLRT